MVAEMIVELGHGARAAVAYAGLWTDPVGVATALLGIVTVMDATRTSMLEGSQRGVGAYELANA
jgi:hypothetical protein